MTKKSEVAQKQLDITEIVTKKLKGLEESGLSLPLNYNATNALKSAFFVLQDVKTKDKKPALSNCTIESIANSLLDMVIQGLNPVKKQCYFIVYGNQLQLMRSYHGDVALLKRIDEVKDIWAEVVYTGDDFELSSNKGRKVVSNFKPYIENQDKEIKAAFAVIEKQDGKLIYEIMTANEINVAWSKTKTGGAVQREFGQEMAKRTVIKRAAKHFINSSDDSGLLLDSYAITTEREFEDENDIKEAEKDETTLSLEDGFKELESRKVKGVEVLEAEPVELL